MTMDIILCIKFDSKYIFGHSVEYMYLVQTMEITTQICLLGKAWWVEYTQYTYKYSREKEYYTYLIFGQADY